MKTRMLHLTLVGLLVLVLLVGAGAGLFGLWLVLDDLGTRGEFLDGVGVAVGIGVIVLLGPPMVLAAKALHAMATRRTNAWQWAASTGIVGVALYFPFGLFYQPAFAAVLLPLAVAVLASLGRPAEPAATRPRRSVGSGCE